MGEIDKRNLKNTLNNLNYNDLNIKLMSYPSVEIRCNWNLGYIFRAVGGEVK